MYQKRISYFYEYENGEKGGNIGFVKFALQNQEYRLQVQVRSQRIHSMELEVYGFSKMEDTVRTISFGNLWLKQGQGEARARGAISKEKAAEFSEIVGVLLLPKAQMTKEKVEYYCVSQWDGQELELSRLDLWQQREQKENVDREEPMEEEIEKQIEEEIEGIEPVVVCAAELEESSDATVEENVVVGEPEVVENEELEKREESGWQAFEERREKLRKQYEKVKKAQQQEEPMVGRWEEGEKILKQFPCMNPFFDSKVLSSVRMEPKDLGYFPMEYWYLANNSFLLHGYYCYRHILFAKLRNRSECQYILAVPGILDYREKFMANMFGFEQFKPVQNSGNEGFGYWWSRIV